MQPKQFLYIILFLLVVFPSFSQKKATRPATLSVAEQQTFDYYFFEAIRLKENKEYDQALELFRLCESIHPTDAGVLMELGLLYNLFEIKDIALAHIEKAVELDPYNWTYNVFLISLYSGTNQIDKAIARAVALEKKHPNKEDLYYIQVSLYKASNQYKKALDAYNKIESITGISDVISFEKYDLYMAMNKPKKALEEIDRLIEKHPTEGQYKVLKGDAFLRQGQPQAAFEAYQKILADDAQNPYVYVSLADYYNEINEPEKAMESVVSALKNNQLIVEEKMGILGLYIEKMIQDTTKFDETESLFKLLIEHYPMEEEVYSYYVSFLLYQNRNVEAISELETMLHINPKNERTWIMLIQLYMTDSNFEEVIKQTSAAIADMPEVPLFYFYKGVAQFQLEQYNDALQTNETALGIIPPAQETMKSDFYSQIGDLNFKLGNTDAAFEAYENSLKINPSNIYVMNNYAYYLSEEKKDLKKAEFMSAKTVEKEPQNSTYLDTYAWIFFQQGNYSLAKFYIERAIKNIDSEQEPGVIYEHYGDILFMMGNDEKAIETWQQAYDSGHQTEELKQKIENKGWEREKNNETLTNE